jgi:toxin ParE1/3/4
MRPRFSPKARRELNDLLETIGQHNPVAAAKWAAKIEERCRLLAQFPHSGTACPDLLPNLRCSSVGSYVIYFRPTKDGIQVVHIVHGARDITQLFRKR